MANCSPINDCNNPCYRCNSCECTCNAPLYETEGCLNYQSTDCSYYNSDDIDCVSIKKKDSLTKVITNIASYITGLFSRVTSSSLTITRQGVCNDSIKIDLFPSTDPSNALTIGTDGKPYVGTTNIDMVATTCISWQKVVTGNRTSIVPMIDWNCVAAQVCTLCANPNACTAPTGVSSMTIGRNSIQIGWNTSAGVIYDVLIGGTLVKANAVSGYTIAGLLQDTLYAITVRARCANGTAADTAINVTTLPMASCTAPSSFVITIV